MRIFNTALISALLTATLSTGAAVAVPATGEAPATALAKRDPNGAWCSKLVLYGGGWVQFTVVSWGSWDDDWGIGLLDNVRGQCDGSYGNTEDWTFDYDEGPPPTNGKATFVQLSGAVDSDCVENAIWLASDPTGAIWGVNCVRVYS